MPKDDSRDTYPCPVHGCCVVLTNPLARQHMYRHLIGAKHLWNEADAATWCNANIPLPYQEKTHAK